MLNFSPELLQTLNEMGLSPGEIRVYLASLSLGPRPAAAIAQKSGLKRGTTYNLLTSLMEKGIAQEFTKGRVRQFTCSSPSKLLSNVDSRFDKLKLVRDKLKTVLPELEQIRNPIASTPTVRFFKGSEGIKEVLEELLITGEKEILGVLDLHSNWTLDGAEAYPWVQRFIERRVELGIWYRGIVNSWKEDDYVVRERDSQFRELKLAEGMSFPAEIMICGSKVVMISATDEKIGIIVDSQAIANTWRSLHKIAWNALSDSASALTGQHSQHVIQALFQI